MAVRGPVASASQLAKQILINSKSSLLNSNAGRRFDTDAGLYYYRARYYGPCVGGFLRADVYWAGEISITRMARGARVSVRRIRPRVLASGTDPSGVIRVNR